MRQVRIRKGWVECRIGWAWVHAGDLEAAPVVPADSEDVKFTFFVAGDLVKATTWV